MFPSTLASVCAIVGVALLPLAFVVLRYYKDKVDRAVSDRISKILVKKEVTAFVKKIKEKKLTFRMVSDFYKQFYEANQPARMLKFTWRGLLISGVFFHCNRNNG